MRQVKAVIIDDTGLVESAGIVIDDEADPPFDPGPGKSLVDSVGAEEGGTWNGTSFDPPPAPAPPTVKEALDTRINSLDTKRVLAALVLDDETAKAKLDPRDLDALEAVVTKSAEPL